MELRHLRYFVAVAEELHFTRAAERLHMAQPALSIQIRQFEQELGIELFLRARRRVKLSEPGRLILEQARRVLDESEQIKVTARRAATAALGELRLGFSGAAHYSALPRVLRDYRRHRRGIKLTLFERASEAQLAMLMRGEIDAGLIRLPLADLPPSLTTVTLVREPLMVALPRTHRLARKRPLHLAALSGEPLIMFPRAVAPGLYDLIMGLGRGAGAAFTIAQEAGQIQTIVSLVAAGLGLAIVPFSIRNAPLEDVVYRRVPELGRVTGMALAYHQENRSPVLRGFIEAALGAVPSDLRAEVAAPALG